MRALIVGLFFAVVAIGWRAGGTDRPAASAAPAGADWRSPRQSGGKVEISRGYQGHFFITGDMAGKPLNFVVDTGATTVAIGREDAVRLGFKLADSDFDREMMTPAGPIMGASITLPRLRIGDIQLLDVHAVVVNIPDTLPLLGQNFLSRLDQVSIQGDKMVLEKR